jgi:RNA polymerase sporulation-specific sigma factor
MKGSTRVATMTKNTADRDDLIRANMALVGEVARGFRRSPLEYDDLIAEGNLALVQAADRYDANQGCFSTFAIPRIRGAILNAVLRSYFPWRQECEFDISSVPDRCTSYEELYDAIDTLPRRKKRMLYSLFGIDGNAMRRKDVASAHNVDPDTVRLTKLKAIETLKRALAS